MTDYRKNYLLPIIIIGVLFFIFGFITWLNATLIPYLEIACELTKFESFLVTFAFYISYFIMALPSSFVLHKTGFKKGMSLGLITIAIGALVFIPAAMTRTYPLFLTGLFIQGTGLSILQTAANPYVTILGPIESAAKRISIMGVANKVAGILSPIILGAIVLDGTDQLVASFANMGIEEKALELDLLAAKVILPYIIIAAILGILAIGVKYSSLPEIEEDEEEENENNPNKKTSLLQFPYLWMGVLSLFVYVGIEVISVDTLISYGSFLGFSMAKAKFFASFTLFAMIVGYFFGIIAIPRFIKQDIALKYFSILGMGLSALAVSTSGFTSILCIAALGFANSIMWPAIWPLAIEGLGKFIKQGSAFLIMAIAGGAVIPLIYGLLAGNESIGSQQAYWIMVPGYAIIFFFAWKGHKIGKTITNKQ